MHPGYALWHNDPSRLAGDLSGFAEQVGGGLATAPPSTTTSVSSGAGFGGGGGDSW